MTWYRATIMPKDLDGIGIIKPIEQVMAQVQVLDTNKKSAHRVRHLLTHPHIMLTIRGPTSS